MSYIEWAFLPAGIAICAIALIGSVVLVEKIKEAKRK